VTTEQSKPLTYADYLAIDELLSLQRPRSDEHDEILFIVIHQVYELWFRQIIHEMRHLQAALEAGDDPVVLATLKRILTILKTLVAQVDVLETMTPIAFNAFRDRLESGSGFQSLQFRVLEFMLGHRRRAIVSHHAEGPGADVLGSMMEEPSLWDSFLAYLSAKGVEVPEVDLRRDRSAAVEESEAVQQALIGVYAGRPTESMVCERLLDLDEGLQEWRYRHVKMVERTIGHKQGTGGSSGVDYLRSTLFRPLFPDLWAIRSRL
jgi:tryptophan 2,3-dioxygenase